MHIAQVNFPPAPMGFAPAQIFERWPTLADVAEAVAGAGSQVTVIQAAAYTQRMTRNGVSYCFIDVAATPEDRSRYVAALLAEIEADVVHLHGLEFAREAFALSQHLPQLPILLQDHANRPPRRWRRPWWRRWYAAASAVAFTSAELAQPFLAANLFPARMPLFSIPESSCRFTPGDRWRAREETGLYGEPGVLWVGHLSMEKGILTVLDGISRAVPKLPDLHLWCAFASAPLRDAVQQRIARDPHLAGRVHLLGNLMHAHIERLMQAADLFVAGSLGESTGYALLEALACGVAPVVTDIPAFRALTDGGRIGRLWPTGDAELLAEMVVRSAATRPSVQQVRTHFDTALSFAALGHRWSDAYRHVHETRRRGMQ